MKEPSRLLLSFLIFPFFPSSSWFFPSFSQFLAIFSCQGWHPALPIPHQWLHHCMTSEFNLLATGEDILNACSINDSTLNSKTWEGETWKASQGNPLKFTMCTLLDQRFSKYISIRICIWPNFGFAGSYTLSVFLQIFLGVKMGVWATWGGGGELSGNYVKLRGWNHLFDFSRGGG